MAKCLSKRIMEKGPVAIIECFEKIPCNPCEAACPFGAIKIGEDITNLPIIDVKKCKGCGLCIPCCPGMAIFVVDSNYSETEALVTFPFEFLPIPGVGSIVGATDRQGHVVTQGEIIRINNAKKNNQTVLISIVIPKNLVDSVRGIQVPV